jgi:hypothetical protein
VIVVGPAFAIPGWGYGGFSSVYPGAYWGDGRANDGGWADAPGGARPTAPERRVPRTRVIEVGPTARPDTGASDVRPGDAASPSAEPLSAEPLRDGALRLRWAGRATAGAGVTLLIADSLRRTLAAQTVYAAPFTAVFDGGARVAFVGVTLARPDGATVTTLLPRAAARAPGD